MAGREISVKKYVVKLSGEEREQLEAMICAGKHPAQSLTKARILLKADVSEAGEGWSDSAISAALDTSINNIGRTRRRMVEEGMAAALTRKYNPNSARPRIFDGAAEAKLIALTCSPAPRQGHRPPRRRRLRTAAQGTVRRAFPDAEQIRLVQDNLSTHTPASLYAAFPAAEARRLTKRFEWHYTPKHGSWLDMAESELAVLSSQCLGRRIPDKPTLEKEVAAWQDHRNKHHAKAKWQFTPDDARVKLKRLYPSF